MSIETEDAGTEAAVVDGGLDVLALCELWLALDFPEATDRPSAVGAESEEAL